LSYGQTIKEIIVACIPPILSNVFFFFTQLTTLFFIGRTENTEVFAAVGTGNMLINVFCLALCYGLNGTLETFISQSFGAGETRMCGVQFNRAKLILTILFIPIMIVYFFSDSILIAAA